MPVVRISKSGGQGEGEALVPGALGGLAGAKAVDAGSVELTRITNNLALAQHIGQFVAGEVAGQFANEDLADVLKGGLNQIMISGSWG